ncbi:MAG: RNA polymerase sigma factor [Bryobacteraceae bacterium]
MSVTLWKPDVGPQELTLGMAQARREEGDFDALLQRHSRQVVRTAYRLLGNLADAEDAAQEVFLRLHRHRDRVDEVRELGSWLYRVTVNVCADARRKKRELPLAEGLDVVSGEAAPDAALDLEQRRRLLRLGLKRLAERERTAVVLRDIESLSTKEVAGIMQTSEGNVRSQLCLARGKLRKFCEEYLRRHRQEAS